MSSSSSALNENKKWLRSSFAYRKRDNNSIIDRRKAEVCADLRNLRPVRRGDGEEEFSSPRECS